MNKHLEKYRVNDYAEELTLGMYAVVDRLGGQSLDRDEYGLATALISQLKENIEMYDSMSNYSPEDSGELAVRQYMASDEVFALVVRGALKMIEEEQSDQLGNIKHPIGHYAKEYLL